MAVVNLSINGRSYEIACDEAHVEHVQFLGTELDRRAAALLRQLGNLPDTRLMVMVGLMLADELTEAQKRAGEIDADSAAALDGHLSVGISSLAQRIEAIADRLERT